MGETEREAALNSIRAEVQTLEHHWHRTHPVWAADGAGARSLIGSRGHAARAEIADADVQFQGSSSSNR